MKKEDNETINNILWIKVLNIASILLLVPLYGFIFSVGKVTIEIWVVGVFYIVTCLAIADFLYQKYFWHKYFEKLKKNIDYKIVLNSEKYTNYKSDVISLENKLSIAINVIILFLLIVFAFEMSTTNIKYDKSMVKLVSSFFSYYTGPVVLGGLIYYQDLIMKRKVIEWIYFDKV